MNIIVWAVKIILNLVVKEMDEMNDKQVFAYGMTLKVPEQDKLEFCQYLKEQGKEWRDYDDLKDIYGNNTIYYLIVTIQFA